MVVIDTSINVPMEEIRLNAASSLGEENKGLGSSDVTDSPVRPESTLESKNDETNELGRLHELAAEVQDQDELERNIGRQVSSQVSSCDKTNNICRQTSSSPNKPIIEIKPGWRKYRRRRSTANPLLSSRFHTEGFLSGNC